MDQEDHRYLDLEVDALQLEVQEVVVHQLEAQEVEVDVHQLEVLEVDRQVEAGLEMVPEVQVSKSSVYWSVK